MFNLFAVLTYCFASGAPNPAVTHQPHGLGLRDPTLNSGFHSLFHYHYIMTSILRLSSNTYIVPKP